SSTKVWSFCSELGYWTGAVRLDEISHAWFVSLFLKEETCCEIRLTATKSEEACVAGEWPSAALSEGQQLLPDIPSLDTLPKKRHSGVIVICKRNGFSFQRKRIKSLQ
ncbi:unnamed protein product, partial [Nippostrongylus brasiliensis]|uniref:Agenet domain-containing protein n=1 Tax=Nippostrongylus brasiliensis TaxID=27835 RepID=A0A0N4XT36_NIPBR